MNLHHFFDKKTATFTYIIIDPITHLCAVIDPILNYDKETGTITNDSIDEVESYIKQHALTLEWILETHAHADHLTGAAELQKRLGGKIAIHKDITLVQKHWAPMFPETKDIPTDGSQFDVLFNDNETFNIGMLNVKVMHTPGHTPACSTYKIGNCLFVGDTIFMPYVGTARTDFPGGSAATLYDSIQKLLALPGDTNIYVGHDYPLEGNQERCQCTVSEQLNSNILINKNVSKEAFIKARNARDENKAPPALLNQSLRVNICAGKN